MIKHYKFPKIGQFNQTIRAVKSKHDFKGFDEEGNPIYIHDSPYPVIKFKGTVKLHGTNSAIMTHSDGSIVVQSRQRIITPESDNAGFAGWVESLPNNVKDILIDMDDACLANGVFGEWCGENIQKGVAISELPKMFVIFGFVDIYPPRNENEDHYKEWHMSENGIVGYHISKSDIKILNDNNIYLIHQFPTYEVEVDFNKPEEASAKISELVTGVESECPVGKHFGITGIGEGIVFTSDVKNVPWFKCKGQKHSSSKVKTPAPVDIEKVKSVDEFVDKVVTESRLEQGLKYLEEMEIPIDMKSTGIYIKWVVNDIRSEESELMGESNLTMKDVGSSLQAAIKPFWFKKVNGVM